MWFWEGTSFWQGPVSVDKMLYPHNYFWTPSSVFTLFLFSGLGCMPVASFFLVPWCFIAHLSQSYELKEEKGLSATMNTVWRKLNQPFQPHIPQLQQQSRTKFLSHSFSRDKLHLWETSGDNWGDGLVGRLVFTEISLCAKGTWATQKHKPWLIPLATPVLLILIILVLFQVQHQLQGHLLRQCHKESNCEFWFPVAGKVVLSYFNGMAVVSSPDCYVELLE